MFAPTSKTNRIARNHESNRLLDGRISMTSIRGLASFLCLMLAMMPATNAQTVSGQISGRVTDPQGAVIGGAGVRLISDLTQQVREFVADESGSFVFVSLVPGEYSLHVEQAGFQTYEQKNI